ncbi:hypothetical protein TcYC6_0026500, partial [Trypanosoma cruzi]
MGSSSSKLTYENGKPSFGEITHVHPMFNGLLFRLSDRKHNRWAFYNDSIEYISTSPSSLTTTVRLYHLDWPPPTASTTPRWGRRTTLGSTSWRWTSRPSPRNCSLRGESPVGRLTPSRHGRPQTSRSSVY